MNLYHITGNVDIVVRASTLEEAEDVTRDVAQEMPSLRDEKEILVEITQLVEPETIGLCYQLPNSITRRIKL